MATIRRIYFYLVSLVSLGMLATGLIQIGQTLLQLWLGSSVGGETFRAEIALSSALCLVGLPVWAGHWWATNRLGSKDITERTAVLRRLYLYVVLAIAALVAGSAASVAVERLFGVLGFYTITVAELVDSWPPLVAGFTVWSYHWRITSRQRQLDGEVGGSATLRRWYVYFLSYQFQIMLLVGVAEILQVLWKSTVGAEFVGLGRDVAASAAAAIVGLLFWMFHWRWSTVGPTAEDDRRSVLRTVYILISLGIAVAVTLFQVSQVLYYVLSRLLGVDRPGGQSGSLAIMLAGPMAVGIAFGASWLYHQRVLRVETAREAGSSRQIGVRRLYHYLVALVAIGLLSVGAGGVLWTLGDLATAAVRPEETWWRERVSLFATLALVGLPTWLVVWRAVVPASEAGALSRRLYVYLSLMAAVLACLGAGATALYEILSILLGARSPGLIVTDLARASAVFVTGAALAGYHWRALRQDARLITHAKPAVERDLAVLTLSSSDGRRLRSFRADRHALEAEFDRLQSELTEQDQPAVPPADKDLQP